MRILILGATGRTGKHILDYALSLKYEVHCLVRYPEKLKAQNGLKIFKGNPIDKMDLEKAVEGCTYIISALNISRISDFPWSRLRTPKNYLSEVMKSIVEQTTDSMIKRVIICSAWGVAETKKDIPFWFRWTIDYSNIKHAYKDHERQEKILTNSHLSWTIVRPVGLTNGKKTQNILESQNNNPKPNLLVNRNSVAQYMVNSIEKPNLIRCKITLSKS